MVTTFNTKDMIQFTNWMMKRIASGEKQADPSGDYEVTHADLENWKLQKSDKSKVKETLCLMNSMILSGEQHSGRSEQLFNEALEELK